MKLFYCSPSVVSCGWIISIAEAQCADKNGVVPIPVALGAESVVPVGGGLCQ